MVNASLSGSQRSPGHNSRDTDVLAQEKNGADEVAMVRVVRQVRMTGQTVGRLWGLTAQRHGSYKLTFANSYRNSVV